MRILYTVLLILFNLIQSNCAEVFEGGFTVTIPGNRILGQAELGVSFDGFEHLVKIEDQGSENPNSMVQIGNLPQITLQKNYKGRVSLKDSKKRSLTPWFYLYAKAEKLLQFEIEPSYYSKANEFHTNSKTDPVFQIDFYEVARVGETEGKLIHSLSKVQLEIGKVNQFDLKLKLTSDKKLAVSISVIGDETHYLHLKARKEGKYPFQLENKEGTYYNPPVRFSYESRIEAAQRSRDLVHSQLVKEINQYVRSHQNYGKDTVIEVPLQLKLELEPKSNQQSARLIEARIEEKTLVREDD